MIEHVYVALCKDIVCGVFVIMCRDTDIHMCYDVGYWGYQRLCNGFDSLGLVYVAGTAIH